MWKHERGSGTRQGQGVPYSVRSFHPTAKATGNKRCPVKTYKEFAEKIQGCSAESPTTRGEKRTFHAFLMQKLQRILVTEDQKVSFPSNQHRMIINGECRLR